MTKVTGRLICRYFLYEQIDTICPQSVCHSNAFYGILPSYSSTTYFGDKTANIFLVSYANRQDDVRNWISINISRNLDGMSLFCRIIWMRWTSDKKNVHLNEIDNGKATVKKR